MIKCLICDQEFNKRVSLCNHLSRKHKLTGKEYYDIYIKTKDEGICKYVDCNKETYFLDIENGYKECCCLEHTNLYRYGVKSNLNLEETKAKAQKNSHTKEAIEKQAKTNLEKYGTRAPLQNKEIMKKSEQTCLDKYGVKNPYQAEEIKMKSTQTKIERYSNPNYNNREKAAQTCLDKFGFTSAAKSQEIKDKTAKTNNEKYGVSSILKLKSTIEKSHTSEAQHKRNIAIRNKILNDNYRNNYEELFMTLIKKHNMTVIPEYDSDVYPFSCDFYLPDKDCYIEINIHWSHGKHWFNSSIDDDNKIKKLWLSKNNHYYNRAVNIWTQSDVEKRNTAKENNLNYVVLWSKQDIIDWFNDDCPIRQDWK